MINNPKLVPYQPYYTPLAVITPITTLLAMPHFSPSLWKGLIYGVFIIVVCACAARFATRPSGWQWLMLN